MAVTQEQATEISNPLAVPPVLNDAHEVHGKLRFARFNFTQGAAAGSAGSLSELVKLPAGAVRVLLDLSIISVSIFGTARTADLGWLAYTDLEGAAVAADPNGLDDGTDVSSAVRYNPIGTVGNDESYLFKSNSGVTIALQTNDGTIPIAATIKGYLVYVVD